METPSDNMKEDSQERNSTKKVPQILRDFMADMLTSFPEYSDNIDAYVIQAISATDIDNEEMSQFVAYVQEHYPSRFFDILYKNEEIFLPDSETEVHFIPGLDFKKIWNTEGITETIKETIWKLSLIHISEPTRPY